MRAVFVNVNPFHILAVNVPGDMVAPVNDKTFLSFLPKLVCHNRAIKTCTDYQIIIFFHLSPLLYSAAHKRGFDFLNFYQYTIFQLHRKAGSSPRAFSLLCPFFSILDLQISDYALNCIYRRFEKGLLRQNIRTEVLYNERKCDRRTIRRTDRGY